jgi:hypothetical protein
MMLSEPIRQLDVPVHEQVNALFAGTQALFGAATPIRKVVVSLGKHRTDWEDALAGTYFRMHLCVESLTRLNNKRDFQIALQVLRTVYELFIDLVELKRNPTLVPQFFAYTFVARFNAAKRLVNEINSQGLTDPELAKDECTFVGDPKNVAKYYAERTKYWGQTKSGQPQTPKTWRNMELPDRAKSIGNHEILRYRKIWV